MPTPFRDYNDAQDNSSVLYWLDEAAQLNDVPLTERRDLERRVYEGWYNDSWSLDQRKALRKDAESELKKYGMSFDWAAWRAEYAPNS